MRIQRTIPPSAAPMHFAGLMHGLIGIFSGARYIERLKEELREHFGVKHVFLVSSGKTALTLILKGLKTLSPEKNRVLIPAYTCSSVPSAILKAGLRVSLCDIKDSTMDFDDALLGEAIDEQTLCVVPCHLFGISSDMDRVKGLCSERGIFVVEDAAQAMGGSYGGRKLGTIGDVGFFSLGRGKNITCGSGGIIITDSDRIADAIEKDYVTLENPKIGEDIKEFLEAVIMSVFLHPGLYWLPAGLPFLKLGQTAFHEDFPMKRFSGMKAGLLYDWKKCLEYSSRIRSEVSRYFEKGMGLKSQWGESAACLRLPVIVDSEEVRDRIYTDSLRLGLGVSKMYPSAINEVDELKACFDGKDFPSASKLSKRLLTVPTHQLLSDEDKRAISELFMKESQKG